MLQRHRGGISVNTKGGRRGTILYLSRAETGPFAYLSNVGSLMDAISSGRIVSPYLHPSYFPRSHLLLQVITS